MTVYSKFNIVYHLQKWMDSVPGQTFLNYAYSWGASVVILGTLFKLTHLPGANIMLFAGMGTEVFVFFLSAFDRPFDKTQDGKELPTHIDDEEIDNEEAEVEAAYEAGRNGESPAEAAAHVGAAVGGGGTIIIGGGSIQGGAVQGDAAAVQGGVFQGGAAVQSGVAGAGVAAGQDAAAVNVAAAAADFAANREVAVQLADAQASYLEQLKNLTETFRRYRSRASASHATARRWRISTVRLPASARFTRCSLREPASRLAPSTRLTSRAATWHSRLNSSTLYTPA